MATPNRQKESDEQVEEEQEEEEEEEEEEEQDGGKHEPQLLPNGIRELNNKQLWLELPLHD